jgi:hypothetical protein
MSLSHGADLIREGGSGFRPLAPAAKTAWETGAKPPLASTSPRSRGLIRNNNLAAKGGRT